MGGVIESGQGTDSLYVNWDSTGNGTVQVVEIPVPEQQDRVQGQLRLFLHGPAKITALRLD